MVRNSEITEKMNEYLECPWCYNIYTKYGIGPHIWNTHQGNRVRVVGNKTNSWNKGLTKETDKRVKKNAENISKYYKNNPHPFKDKKHKKEILEKMGKKLRVAHHGDFFRCSACGEFKHRDEYRKNSDRWNGLSYNCKICNSKKDKIQYKKNKLNERDRSQRYRENHKEDCRERSKKHYRNNKERYLKKNAKRRRNLKWIKLMDSPFPKEIEVDWHHINNIFVIPIPKITHLYHYNPKTKKHRELCNKKLVDLNLIPKVSF